MKRRAIMAGLVGLAGVPPITVRAQQAAKTHTILWVSTESQSDPFIAGFREGMRNHGYVEGQNLAVVTRYAPGDPSALKAMLPELLAIPADLIVSSGPAIRAMHGATDRTVLFAMSGDPVALGIAESLARPGRNFTGCTFMSLDLAQERVELLHDILPNLETLAVLSYADHPGEASEHDATERAARAFSIRLAYAPFASGHEIEAALDQIGHTNAGAMLVFPDGITLNHRVRIAQFAIAHRLPSMFGWSEYCEAGGLTSYGANQRATYVRLAAYAHRLLQGEKPADIPIEEPTIFELVLNTGTAKELGLDIPPLLLARVDRLIE
jgi:putative ABC transport system substrate-binding protein